jgi:hypothetical protein
VYNVVAIEDVGTPAVVLVNRGFVNDARSACSGKGLPGVRVIPESVACESNVAADIESGVATAMEDIIGGLTRPLTAEEKAPRKESEQLSRIVFKGSLQEVNRFFYQRGWSDGLPIIPPTEEAVAEMLTGTDLAPDHVVTRIIPRLGKATIERIAINAVMAGALPTYMPLLITAAHALMDTRARFDIFEVSTGSWAPFWAINGPIRNDIHINCSSGSLSPGNMANATIGRAVGLMVKNIGGARKAVEDMGVIGNPGKYALVIGEHEEESPWAPLHVDRGFRREDSTMTLFLPNTFVQTIPRDTSAQGVADMLVGLSPGTLSCFILIPSWASVLSSEGWTKQKVIEYIARNSKTPFAQANPPATRPDINPEDLIIVVAGGPGAFSALLRSAGGSMMGNGFVTKKIDLPKSWDKLVARYKGIVPTYFRY